MITDERLKKAGKTKEVKSATATSDNLTEILLKVLEFTQIRQKILVSNFRDFDKPGFVPTDLPCGEFSDVLNIALNEQEKNNRLLFIDTNNIKFMRGGSFEAGAVPDNYAKYLMKISLSLRLIQKLATSFFPFLKASTISITLFKLFFG